MSDLVVRGVELMGRGHVSEAIACFEQQLAEAPAHIGALNNLANAYAATGRIDQALAIYDRLLPKLDRLFYYRIASNYLAWLQYQPSVSPEALKNATCAITARYPAEEPVDFNHRPRSGRPLRVGLISADLCDHPVGMFLLPLLQNLDLTKIEPVLYSTGGRIDPTHDALRRAADRHEVGSLDYDALVVRLRNDQLDVIVDLSGHTGGHRLPALARRVAPIQMSWMGYSATTGVSAIDYVMMDPLHAPPGTEAFFTETIVRMPHSRFCFRPARFAPEVAPPPCLANGYVTFGSFNNTAKYNAALFDTWAAILREVGNSRLILKWWAYADADYREATLRSFQERGIDRDRIELREASVHRDLLGEYADIDIALDPFPFSGGLTTCEALWQGVPVITLPSARPISRQTLCFVSNLDHLEVKATCVASSDDDYVRRATALAGGFEMLRYMREQMRSVAISSRLMDESGFARDFEEVVHLLAVR